MTTPAGTPIWYELITPDPEGAKRFYDAVMGWSVQAQPPGELLHYRMIAAAGGLAGGVLAMDAEMTAAGMQPVWLPYFQVEDVDGKVREASALGAQVLVPPTDVQDVGRFSLLRDPQGALVYIMHALSDEAATVFAPGQPGFGGWNELWTSDAAGATSFYRCLLGLENRETMNMGPRGGYHFLDLGERRIGALFETKTEPSRWNIYFTVPDIHQAMARTTEHGGAVTLGPHEVPTGETIVMGRDPQGASFALVGPGHAEGAQNADGHEHEDRRLHR